MKKQFVILLIAAGLISSGSMAGTATSVWTVNGLSAGTCTITTAGNVTMPDLNSSSSTGTVMANTTVTTNCSSGLPYTVAPDSLGAFSAVSGEAARGKAADLTQHSSGAGTSSGGSVSVVTYVHPATGSDVAWDDLNPIVGTGDGTDQTHNIIVKSVINGFL
ncbi:MAG: hypothetical protein Q7U24_05370, partial [Sulfurimicrobium sp.]|nr:hypothetical protein [Sulfurimicrobium sp.]